MKNRKARTGSWQAQAARFGVEVKSGAYHRDGYWFQKLKKFPGALFDPDGFLLFGSEQEFQNAGNQFLSIRKEIGVLKPYRNISDIPGYVRCTLSGSVNLPDQSPGLVSYRHGERELIEPKAKTPPDLDFGNPFESKIEIEEGQERFMNHLLRERNRSLVSKKKEQVRGSGRSVACEVCGFVFAEKYGKPGCDYCEVHHLIPLANKQGVRNTRLEDLAIVCANCHRVIHTRNPAFTLEEMRAMLIG